MAKALTTKQSNFERKPADSEIKIPEAGLKELEEMVAFLNDDDNREIVSKWNRSMRELKATIKEHVDIEDVGGGIRLQFGDVGEVVIAPQKFAARNIQTDEKQIMRFTVVGAA